jgi:phage I-like protein
MIFKDRTFVLRATKIISGTVPDEIQIAPFGKWAGYRNDDGELLEFEVTPEIAAKAIEYHKNFNARYPERDLPIDYEHQTLYGGEAPAAGWYKNLFLKNDGIYAKIKEWTKKGEQYLLNKEYRYQSPVLLFNDVDGETGEKIPLWVPSIALTNSPFINGIQPVIAKNDKKSTIIILTNSQTIIKGDTTMPTIEEVIAFLVKIFGLPADATWDVIKAKLQSFMDTEGKEPGETVAAKYRAAMQALSLDEHATLEDVKAFALKHTSILAELGVKATDTVEEIKKNIAAKGKSAATPGIDSPTVIALTDRVNMLTAQLAEREFGDVIAKHIQRGAVLPAEIEDLKADVVAKRIACKDLDARLAKRADHSMVPLNTIDTNNPRSASSVLDDNTVAIAAKMGVSKADLEKYGKNK